MHHSALKIRKKKIFFEEIKDQKSTFFVHENMPWKKIYDMGER